MKIKLLFLMLFTSVVSFAQIKKISELSSNKLLDSKIIYEEDNENIYGYLLLFEKDKVDKNELVFDLVLLDKNLNKVGATSFAQEIYSTWLIKLSSHIYFAKKNKDNLFVSIGQSNPMIESYIDSVVSDKGTTGFRILNLKDFTISQNYFIKDFKFQLQTEKFDMQHPSKMMKEMKNMKFAKMTTNGRFLVSDMDYMSAMNEAMNEAYPGLKQKVIRQTEFHYFNLDFQEKWVYKFNQDQKSKSFYKYNYYTNAGNDIVLIKKFYKKNNDVLPELSFDIVDEATGVRKFEISLANDQFTLAFDNLQVIDNKIIVFASVYEFDDSGNYKYARKKGHIKMVYDQQTGTILSEDFFKWDALAGELDIDENGKIKSYGFIHFLEFKSDKEGKTVIIAEGYKPESSTKILDLFTIVLDEKLKVVSFNKIDKFVNKINKIEAYGSSLENMGAFDYMYSQKLPGGGYVFYYSDNEKVSYSSRRDPKWILGVITYIDGVFEFQKVPLTTKNGRIYPIKAKNGYILLREVSNDEKNNDSEIRLERINY